MNILIRLFRYLVGTTRFLGSKERYIFIVVILAAIVAPVFDLIFYKLLADVFGSVGIINDATKLVRVTTPLVLVLVISNGIKYYTRTKKVMCVSKIIEVVSNKTKGNLGGTVNWLRMLLLEYLNVVTSFFHVSVIGVCSVAIHATLGAILLICLFSAHLVAHKFFVSEVVRQKSIQDNKDVSAWEKGEMVVVSRVTNTERVSVYINLIFLLYFITLVLFYLAGQVNSGTALIFLFLVRFVSTNQVNLVASLMRFSRGWSHISHRMEFLEKHV